MPDFPLPHALRQHVDDQIPVIPLEEVEARAADEPVRTPHRRRNVLAVAAVVAAVAASGLTVRAVVDRSPEDVVAGPAEDAWCAALAAPANDGAPMKVFLAPGADRATVEAVADELRRRPEVQALRYLDAAAAFAEAQALFADQPTLLRLLREGDVPSSYRVQVTDGDQAFALARDAEDWPGVQQVETAPTAELPPDATGLLVDDRVLERLGRVAEGFSAEVADRPRQELRTTSPDDVVPSVEVLDPLLDWALPARVPTTYERVAATFLITEAGARCDLRPRQNEPSSSTATTSTTAPR